LQNRRQAFAPQALTVHLAAHRGQRVDRPRVTDMQPLAVAQLQRLPGRARQSDFVVLEQAGIGLVQGCDDFAVGTAQPHPGMGDKAFRAAYRAVGAQDRDRPVAGVEIDAARPQVVAGFGQRLPVRRGLNPAHDSE